MLLYHRNKPTWKSRILWDNFPRVFDTTQRQFSMEKEQFQKIPHHIKHQISITIRNQSTIKNFFVRKKDGEKFKETYQHYSFRTQGLQM